MSNNKDLSELINNFTISSSEEKLTKQFDKTHIATCSNVPSIFTISTPTQPISETNQEQSWMNDNKQKEEEEEDGWGEAPPNYTSITQGTYFGFNSIIQPQPMFQNTSHNNNVNSLNAFSRYKNQPASFLAAFENKDQ